MGIGIRAARREALEFDEGQTGKLAKLGALVREQFLAGVRKASKERRKVGDLDIVSALDDDDPGTPSDGIARYIRRMSVPPGHLPSEEQ